MGTLGFTNYLNRATYKKYESIWRTTGWDNSIDVELDLEFCAKYGHDDYSLRALNYLDRTPSSLPALASLEGLATIGNILLLVENGNYEVDVVFGDGIRAIGYAYDVSSRKKKSYFCLFGVSFEQSLIRAASDKQRESHTDDVADLDEIRLGTIGFPVLYIDRVTGRLFTCSCFDGQFDTAQDLERRIPYGNSEEGLIEQIKNIGIADSICHYCNGGIPKYEYGNSMYYSSFLQRYLPYFTLMARKEYGKKILDENESRLIEDGLRERFGYPKIGQQWITETTLFKLISMVFPDNEIVHHYRGKELEGLELDIWFPNLLLGIEYQGEQHYKIIDHWGGKDGFEKRTENDRKKKQLCKKLGYRLVEFDYAEKIEEELIRKKLARFFEN